MTLLSIEGLGITFGGLKAVRDVSFAVKPGEIVSVIGPNGAGKTTLFNMISGIYRPNAGRVVLEGTDVTAMEPHLLARRGLSRTFQNLQIFQSMTVLENVVCGFHLRERGWVLADLLGLSHRRSAASAADARALLDRVGLGQAAGREAGNLSYGAMKRLEIARALALSPKVLLLDEPAAGCNATETEEIDHLIAEVAKSGVAILLVEHDMKMVMRISNHVVVLDHGEKIAEGPPAAVSQNPAVIAAYLGGPNMLKVEGLRSRYGRIEVLHGIDLTVEAGEIVTVVGANGAGKTTLLRCLSGVQPVSGGNVAFQGKDLSGVPAWKRAPLGLTQSPEGRQIFTNLSVEENLRLGAYHFADAQVASDMDDAFAMFPILREKRNLAAGGLSGGQQQMLAMARALMGRPSCLLLDEPSMGLAPIIVSQIFDVIRSLKARGVTVLLVEQNAYGALKIADRGYVMETGRIAMSGLAADLIADPRIREAYLGI